MHASLTHHPSSPPPERWLSRRPGLRQLHTPAGPTLQYIDAVGFERNVYELAIPGLDIPSVGLRILHLADLHCREDWQEAYDELIHHLHAHPPDIILFTGDFVDDTNTPRPALPVVNRLLGNLSSIASVYGIRGNHDYNISAGDLAASGIHLVDGKRLMLTANNHPLELIALPGPDREHLTHEWIDALPPRTPGIPRIVIGHYPDHIRRLERAHPDVYLAGHTHGGQVCFPGAFPVIRHDSLPWRLCRGVHRYANSWLVVSKGIGFSDVPFRLFCPAEVAELRLVHADEVSHSSSPETVERSAGASRLTTKPG